MKADAIQELLDALLTATGEGRFRILSGSMSPLIERDDRIVVKPSAAGEIQLLDIILFKEAGVFMAHRVISVERKKQKTLFLQKGDASAYAALIPSDSVMGKVTAIEKKGRLIELTRGRGRVLNVFLGLKSCLHYRYGTEAGPVAKKILRTAASIFQKILFKLCL